MKEIKGNLLATDIENIVHGCNCVGGFGSGVAGAVAYAYPEAREAYHDHIIGTGGGPALLGSYVPVNTRDGKHTIWNAFTQVNFGGDGRKYASYTAVYDALRGISEDIFADTVKPVSIAVPQIGCGLGGLDWEFVKEILVEIEERSEFTVNFTVYSI